MSEKKILGLDLGPNSIGWTMIVRNETESTGKILGMGARIIPMSQEVISKFGEGTTLSQTAERTKYRGVRRLRQRHLLRRERLLKVLKKMAWIPKDFDPEQKDLPYSGPNGTRDFSFQESYEEMSRCFHDNGTAIDKKGRAKKIPHAWTIYYLRKKALSEKISGQELAWVILQFNQKRGYYQLRGEESEDKIPSKKKEYITAIVTKVEDTGDQKGKNKILKITLDNGMSGTMQRRELPDWKGLRKDIKVSTDLDKEGNIKLVEGTPRHFFSIPDEEDWGLLKDKAEKEIRESGQTVGTYIFDHLLRRPDIKIRGKLVRTIERDFYHKELAAILNQQRKYHPELRDATLYQQCVTLLYPKNEARRRELAHKDLGYLLLEDIIFYQRPLKSKKHLIEGCRFERRYYKDKDKVEQAVKVPACPKSHPLFQEFRMWQFLANLKIVQKEGINNKGFVEPDMDVTHEYIGPEQLTQLFGWMQNRKSVKESHLLKQLGLDDKDFRWNYLPKEYPANETVMGIYNRIKKQGLSDVKTLLNGHETKLWHILYSVSDRQELKKALQSYCKKNDLPEGVVTALAKFPPFKNDYAAYSLKALNKLLPFMRMGTYYDRQAAGHVVDRLDHELNDELMQKADIDRDGTIESLQGLSHHSACYIVYGRHSEAEDTEKYKRYSDIHLVKQHSLRNPIAEQVINETLLVVRDIWKKYGRPQEVHVELSRDLKKNAKERKSQTLRINADEQRNLRIKAILQQLREDPDIEGEINPNSPRHLEKLKLWEESRDEDPDIATQNMKEIFKDSRTPTLSEIARYKLWADQHHISPYTGRPIPLAKLFTPDYEIEHVLPKSRLFNDSLNNKIIAEADINKDKGNKTGYAYVLDRSHKDILPKESYEALVKKMFKYNPGKRKIMLSKEVPEGFINRQMNDTRYISRKIGNLMERVAEERVVFSNGMITSELRNEWGLHEVMKDLTEWRFQRMNELSENSDWYQKAGNQRYLKAYTKRIDHRHHALDALIVACTTQKLVLYVNTLEAQYKNPEKKADFQHLIYNKARKFKKPWDSIVQEARACLETTAVSFKNRNRAITKTVNRFQAWQEVDGSLKKVWKKQVKGDLWAIRKPLHDETIFGKVSLRSYKEMKLNSALKTWKQIADPAIRKKIGRLFQRYDGDLKKVINHLKENPLQYRDEALQKVQVYTHETFAATRKPLDDSFDEKRIKGKVTDHRLRKILLEHLAKYSGNAKQAFSPDGIEAMNKDLPMPIYKVRLKEDLGKKIQLGSQGSKAGKFAIASAGTNLLFVIYENESTGERLIGKDSSINFKDIIEAYKIGEMPVEEKVGYTWFTISPHEMMYVPKDENDRLDFIRKNGGGLNAVQMQRLYKMVSCSKGTCYFLPNAVATVIEKGKEFGSLDKTERDIGTNRMIKQVGIKCIVNRLGEIQMARQSSDR